MFNFGQLIDMQKRKKETGSLISHLSVLSLKASLASVTLRAGQSLACSKMAWQ